jgi:hypothetical protein
MIRECSALDPTFLSQSGSVKVGINNFRVKLNIQAAHVHVNVIEILGRSVSSQKVSFWSRRNYSV